MSDIWNQNCVHGKIIACCEVRKPETQSELSPAPCSPAPVEKFCPKCQHYRWDCQCESPRGFTSAPTPEQLKPTPQEQHLLECLWAWERQGSKSQAVWSGKA